MHKHTSNITFYSSPAVTRHYPKETEDYTEILKFYGQEYKVVDYYLLVGEIASIQGWILHISVVISQVSTLLEIIIPELIREKVPFKIAKNKDITRFLLDGYLDYTQVGKVIIVYTENDKHALYLAKKLVELTKPYKGPAVPTDIHLGGTVYTNYGSYSPIVLSDATGKQHKYLYDQNGKLVKELNSIPFVLPTGVQWPFTELANSKAPEQKKILNNFCKPLSVLKADARGNVFKGIYVKGFLRSGHCVIKEGRQYMISDDAGQDIHDRLVWQQELHQELCDIIPLPKILDLFTSDGNTYLVMEFIKGVPLYERKTQITHDCKTWFQLSVPDQLRLLDYILKILLEIERLHQKGYVHRDIQPANFLIDSKEGIFLIDIELAYSLNKKRPFPPFTFGTAGFMSPEQERISVPSEKEDIYGFGALITELFTCLSPIKFSTKEPSTFAERLNFFIANEQISNLIAACLDNQSEFRPDIPPIKSTLQLYRQELQTQNDVIIHKPRSIKIDSVKLKEIIAGALNGLTKSPIPISRDLWLSKNSKNQNLVATEKKEYSPYVGMHEGISGVLYLLARTKRIGFNIDESMKSYRKAWEFIEGNYLKFLPNIVPGLYGGAAGIALSLAEGIRAGLLENRESSRQTIQNCLALAPASFLLSTGIAGQGISTLQCSAYLDKEFVQTLLQQFVHSLIDNQQKDGSWLFDAKSIDKTQIKTMGFGDGISGIIWFLLEYISHYEDSKAQQAVIKSLEWLKNRTNKLKNLFIPKGYTKIIKGGENGDERTGIVLCFIKAYETFKHTHYKRMVEDALRQYPAFAVNNNFSQDTGLAGLGELYLEARRAFNSDEWQERANWIAGVFIHTFHRQSDGSGYWLMEENYTPTADLMVGNSGIIHFLSRCLEPDALGYRLLA